MAEARDATIGGAAAAAAATDDEWDIHDRLKNLLSMFATSDHSSVEATKAAEKLMVESAVYESPSPGEKEKEEEEEAKWETLSNHVNIPHNVFVQREHVQQKDDDIAVCECQYKVDDPESACGELCLNSLTNTECTPCHCPSAEFCRNQRFQRCDYAKLKLVKTDGRGWGLIADQDIKEGQFVMEYCGEVVSDKVAQSRVQVYEEVGLKEKYIISLHGSEFIDATRKGSLARYINHSCDPNCVTRKWTVLGEVRIGIFAIKDISAETEVTYDYNFQWYGGSKIQCRCGAESCVGFLGAKSRGFQRNAYGLDDEDKRYAAESSEEDAMFQRQIYEVHRQHIPSNHELLSQLFDIAVGIRNFKVVNGKPRIVQVAEEVKDKTSLEEFGFLQTEGGSCAEKECQGNTDVAIPDGIVAGKPRAPLEKLPIRRPKSYVTLARKPSITRKAKYSSDTDSDSEKKSTRQRVPRIENKKPKEDEQMRQLRKLARKGEEAGIRRHKGASDEQVVTKKARFASSPPGEVMVNHSTNAFFLNQPLPLKEARILATKFPYTQQKLAWFHSEEQWWCLTDLSQLKLAPIIVP
ncbi:unnamed protein product [Sphagnum tenellum]